MNRLVSMIAIALAAVLPVQAARAAPSPAAPGAGLAQVTGGERLDRMPRYGPGGDVDFAVPVGRGWTSVPNDRNVPVVLHLSNVSGEQALAAWRAPDATPDRPYPERPFIYLYATAIPLDQYPGAQGADGVAALKLAAYCSQTVYCDVRPATAGAAGGAPTVAYYVAEVHRFPGENGKNVAGIANDRAGEDSTSQIEFRSRLVFLVRGNWGYAFQLIATQPRALADRFGDLDELLRGLTFTYGGAAPAVAPAAPPAPTPVPAPVPAPVPTPGAAETSAGGRLGHPPRVGTGGDLDFQMPPGRAWTQTQVDDRLRDALRRGTLDGEQIVDARRVLNGLYSGPFVYLITAAIPLDAHPEITTVGDLADRKLVAYRQQSRTFDVDAAQTGVAGGTRIAIYDTRRKLEFKEDGIPTNGITAQGAEDSRANEIVWTSRHVFAIRGNWGYEFLLAAAEAGPTYGRYGDLDQMLASLQFSY